MAVLSIQSHVVYGYAGNTSAVFPMQRMGREVWAVNTVEFSNHTGYSAWRGKVLGAALASSLVRGLAERDVLDRCEAVLSGYLGDASLGNVIAKTVRQVRKKSKNALYCCDPVMGDTGKGLYVKPDIPGIFIKKLVPLADIVTPNHFELEVLTGICPDTIENTCRAMDILHKMGPSVVLVTSYHEGAKADLISTNSQISMLVSDSSGKYKIDTPQLPLGTTVAGCGDLTAAVFLSRYLETRDSKRTLELCTASIYGILERSFLENRNKELNAQQPMELLIVHAQEELINPSHVFTPVKIK